LSATAVATPYSPPEINKWVVALSIAPGSLMATIDSSIVNVAIPHIRGTIGATVEEIAWISTAYIVAMVLIMPLTGLLGAVFGQKRLYIISLLLFLAGSILCGMARTLPVFVAFRILQGLGAGSLQPSQQAILRQTFPLEEQGMAMAIYSMVIMVGPAVGPVLGGWITDNMAWPWIFYINVPIGIIGVFLTMKYVFEPTDVRHANVKRAAALREHMDWAGIALMIVAIASLQYFLEEGPTKDWFHSTPILVCGFVAVVSLIAFVIRELSCPQPVVNLRLFRDPTFASGTVIAAIVYAALIGNMFLLPVYMQELLGFDATQSGIALIPRTIAMLIVTPFVGRLYNSIPPALVIGFGAIMFIFGSYELSFITLQSGMMDIVVPLVIMGSSLACLMIPLTTVALSTTARKDLADAAGLNSFVRQIGGSIGITVFTTLLANYAIQAKAGVAAHVSLLRPELQPQLGAMMHQLVHRVADWNLAHALMIKILSGRATVEGMVLSFDKLFVLQAILFAVVIPLLFFLRSGREGPAETLEISLE